MSLSFVSKSVLTAKEGGDGYEEKPIEGNEEVGSTATSYSKPLFEQLRANKEQEEQEREEFQKSIMRGTLALDEEDCAHLDAVQKQKAERNQAIQRETQSELEAFRAAQAISRMEQGALADEDDDDDEEEKEKPKPESKPPAKATAQKKAFVPKIVVKKRKKVVDVGTVDTKKPKAEPKKNEEETPKPAMGGLLDGYGSDSDSD
jgi:FAM192A/Fyv6, N-terminal domain